MLVDIRLETEDVLQVTRAADGKFTLTIPLNVLIRSYNCYMNNKDRFDALELSSTAKAN